MELLIKKGEGVASCPICDGSICYTEHPSSDARPIIRRYYHSERFPLRVDRVELWCPYCHNVLESTVFTEQ